MGHINTNAWQSPIVAIRRQHAFSLLSGKDENNAYLIKCVSNNRTRAWMWSQFPFIYSNFRIQNGFTLLANWLKSFDLVFFRDLLIFFPRPACATPSFGLSVFFVHFCHYLLWAFFANWQFYYILVYHDTLFRQRWPTFPLRKDPGFIGNSDPYLQPQHGAAELSRFGWKKLFFI